MSVYITESSIRQNWDVIKNDPDMRHIESESPDELITAIKRGEVVVGGCEVKILNKLPPLQEGEQ